MLLPFPSLALEVATAAEAARLEGIGTTVQSVKTIWDRIGHFANRVPTRTLQIIAERKDIVQALPNRSPK